jgi:tetratricopeptide (TPR) repeat protein
MPLEPSLTRKIKALCAEGYHLYDQDAFKEGLRLFYKALTLVPKPHTDQVEAGWVLTAIGDCYFRSQQWDQGRESLASALRCPGMMGNPFIHLRLGQCLYELDKKEVAIEHLELSYMNGGSKLFQNEAPKYLIAAMENISDEDLSIE